MFNISRRRWQRGGVLNYLIGPIKLIRSVKKTPRVRGLIWRRSVGVWGRAPIIRNSCKRCGLTALCAPAAVCLFSATVLFILHRVHHPPPSLPPFRRPFYCPCPRILLPSLSHTRTRTKALRRASLSIRNNNPFAPCVQLDLNRIALLPH